MPINMGSQLLAPWSVCYTVFPNPKSFTPTKFLQKPGPAKCNRRRHLSRISSTEGRVSQRDPQGLESESGDTEFQMDVRGAAKSNLGLFISGHVQTDIWSRDPEKADEENRMERMRKESHRNPEKMTFNNNNNNKSSLNLPRAWHSPFLCPSISPLNLSLFVFLA